MNDYKIISLLDVYFKGHFKTILLFGLFSVIFGVVFFLYDLPAEATGYGVLLCLCVGFVFTGFDFFRVYQRHRALFELKKHVVFNLEGLVPPKGIIERDYQEIVNILHEDKIKYVSANDTAKSELVDYYTLWAHQIKTPVSAMRLLLQIEQNSYNALLAAELFKIEQYVEMVLQYLRLDSVSTDYLIKRYNLDGIVKQAVRKYASFFISKKISLEFEELDIEVLTDEKWLLFVVEQVLSNALKYTAAGAIYIFVEDGALVIKDTGVGIDEEDIARVFEKGFTGYNGRADKKSTGIGLYLCKRILTNLSHTITVKSEAGKGTTVKIGFDTVKLMVE